MTARHPRLPRWFPAANRRRGELVVKRHRGGGLTPAEAAELADLHRRCKAAVNAAFPRDAARADAVLDGARRMAAASDAPHGQ